jgi:heterotetrameric sarcosine oxidase gamma subunit
VVKREPESALRGTLRAGRSGVLASAPGVQVSEAQPTAMFQISGAFASDESHGVSSLFAPVELPEPLHCTSGEGVRLLWNGPGRFLATIDSTAPNAIVDALLDGEKVGSKNLGEIACVDVSHAWSVLRVQGPSAHDLLAKGCAVDLEQMRADACRPTAVGRFDVLLCCVADDGFDLFVARSLAQSFADWLLRAGAEFGVTVCEWRMDEGR